MKKKTLFSMLAASFLGFVGLAASSRADSPGQRLSRIIAARSNISVYISVDGYSWESATSNGEIGVNTASRSWSYDAIERFVVAYPGGELLDAHGAVRLPEGTHYMHDAEPVDFALDQTLLLRGATISFTKSPTHPQDSDYHKTSIRNDSQVPLHVLRFGGFTPDGAGLWRLNNVAGGFYTSNQFADWYDCPNASIPVGHTVFDSTNYGGRPVLWAYEVQAGAERFWVGGVR